MILLTSTSDLIWVTTGSGASVEVHSSWVDTSGGTQTPGRTNTAAITTATTTTVVGSPGASTQRNLKYLSVFNDHASISTTIEVSHTDGTTAETLHRCTLLARESLLWTEQLGWRHLNSQGVPYAQTVGAGGPVDVQTFVYGGSTTWTKPTTFTPTVVFVKLWGAGGGGGAGASLATAVIAKGGAGGGGGGFLGETYLASDLPSTVTVTVGQGGAAGAPGAAGAAGGNGGIGGTTSFGSYGAAYGEIGRAHV